MHISSHEFPSILTTRSFFLGKVLHIVLFSVKAPVFDLNGSSLKYIVHEC